MFLLCGIKHNNYTEATAGAWGLASGADLTLPAGAAGAFANFALYPNPANSSIQIDLGTLVESNISVINAMDREVLTITNYQANTAINVSDLKKGIYFVRVSPGNNQIVKKLIID